MKLTISLTAAVLALFAVTAPASTRPQATTSVQFALPDTGWYCGHVTTSDYCLNIPLSNGWRMWIDTQPKPTSFVQVNGISYPVTSPFEKLQLSTDPTHVFTMKVTFGQRSSMTIHYTTYYSNQSRQAGWYWIITNTSTLNFQE